MCLKEIRLHAQNMLIILDSIVIIIREECTRIFTFITNWIHSYELPNYEENGEEHDLDSLNVLH